MSPSHNEFTGEAAQSRKCADLRSVAQERQVINLKMVIDFTVLRKLTSIYNEAGVSHNIPIDLSTIKATG